MFEIVMLLGFLGAALTPLLPETTTGPDADEDAEQPPGRRMDGQCGRGKDYRRRGLRSAPGSTARRGFFRTVA